MPALEADEPATTLSMLAQRAACARASRRLRSPSHAPPALLARARSPWSLGGTTYAEIVKGGSSRSSSIGSRHRSERRYDSEEPEGPSPLDNEADGVVVDECVHSEVQYCENSDIRVLENVGNSESFGSDAKVYYEEYVPGAQVNVHAQYYTEPTTILVVTSPMSKENSPEIQELIAVDNSLETQNVVETNEIVEQELDSSELKERSHELSYAEILALGLRRQTQIQNVTSSPKPQDAQIELVKEVVECVEQPHYVQENERKSSKYEPKVDRTESMKLRPDRYERPLTRSRSREMPRQRRGPEKRPTKAHEVQPSKKKKTNKKNKEVQDFDEPEPDVVEIELSLARPEKKTIFKPVGVNIEVVRKLQHSPTIVEKVTEIVTVEEMQQEELSCNESEKKIKKKSRSKKHVFVEDEIQKALKEIEEHDDKHKKKKSKELKIKEFDLVIDTTAIDVQRKSKKKKGCKETASAVKGAQLVIKNSEMSDDQPKRLKLKNHNLDKQIIKKPDFEETNHSIHQFISNESNILKQEAISTNASRVGRTNVVSGDNKIQGMVEPLVNVVDYKLKNPSLEEKNLLQTPKRKTSKIEEKVEKQADVQPFEVKSRIKHTSVETTDTMQSSETVKLSERSLSKSISSINDTLMSKNSDKLIVDSKTDTPYELLSKSKLENEKKDSKALKEEEESTENIILGFSIQQNVQNTQDTKHTRKELLEISTSTITKAKKKKKNKKREKSPEHIEFAESVHQLEIETKQNESNMDSKINIGDNVTLITKEATDVMDPQNESMTYKTDDDTKPSKKKSKSKQKADFIEITKQVAHEDSSVGDTVNLEGRPTNEIKSNKKKSKTKETKSKSKHDDDDDIERALKDIERAENNKKKSKDKTSKSKEKPKPYKQIEINKLIESPKQFKASMELEKIQDVEENVKPIQHIDWNTLLAEEENMSEVICEPISHQDEELKDSSNEQVATEVTILQETIHVSEDKKVPTAFAETDADKDSDASEKKTVAIALPKQTPTIPPVNEQNNNDKFFLTDSFKDSSVNTIEEVTRYQPITEDLETRTIYLITHEEKKLPPIRTVKMFSSKNNSLEETDSLDDKVIADSNITDEMSSISVSEIQSETSVENIIDKNEIRKDQKQASPKNMVVTSTCAIVENLIKCSGKPVDQPKETPISRDNEVKEEDTPENKDKQNPIEIGIIVQDALDTCDKNQIPSDKNEISEMNESNFTAAILEEAIFGSVQNRGRISEKRSKTTTRIPYQELKNEFKTYSLDMDTYQLDYEYYKLMQSNQNSLHENNTGLPPYPNEAENNKAYSSPQPVSHIEPVFINEAYYREIKDAENVFASQATNILNNEQYKTPQLGSIQSNDNINSCEDDKSKSEQDKMLEDEVDSCNLLTPASQINIPQMDEIISKPTLNIAFSCQENNKQSYHEIVDAEKLLASSTMQPIIDKFINVAITKNINEDSTTSAKNICSQTTKTVLFEDGNENYQNTVTRESLLAITTTVKLKESSSPSDKNKPDILPSVDKTYELKEKETKSLSNILIEPEVDLDKSKPKIYEVPRFTYHELKDAEYRKAKCTLVAIKQTENPLPNDQINSQIDKTDSSSKIKESQRIHPEINKVQPLSEKPQKEEKQVIDENTTQIYLMQEPMRQSYHEIKDAEQILASLSSSSLCDTVISVQKNIGETSSIKEVTSLLETANQLKVSVSETPRKEETLYVKPAEVLLVTDESLPSTSKDVSEVVEVNISDTQPEILVKDDLFENSDSKNTSTALSEIDHSFEVDDLTDTPVLVVYGDTNSETVSKSENVHTLSPNPDTDYVKISISEEILQQKVDAELDLDLFEVVDSDELRNLISDVNMSPKKRTSNVCEAVQQVEIDVDSSLVPVVFGDVKDLEESIFKRHSETEESKFGIIESIQPENITTETVTMREEILPREDTPLQSMPNIPIEPDTKPNTISVDFNEREISHTESFDIDNSIISTCSITDIPNTVTKVSEKTDILETRVEKSPIHSLHDLLPEIDSIPEFKPSFSNTILYSKLSADAPEFTPSYMYQSAAPTVPENVTAVCDLNSRQLSAPVVCQKSRISFENTLDITDEKLDNASNEMQISYSSVLRAKKEKLDEPIIDVNNTTIEKEIVAPSKSVEELVETKSKRNKKKKKFDERKSENIPDFSFTQQDISGTSQTITESSSTPFNVWLKASDDGKSYAEVLADGLSQIANIEIDATYPQVESKEPPSANDSQMPIYQAINSEDKINITLQENIDVDNSLGSWAKIVAANKTSPERVPKIETQHIDQVPASKPPVICVDVTEPEHHKHDVEMDAEGFITVEKSRRSRSRSRDNRSRSSSNVQQKTGFRKSSHNRFQELTVALKPYDAEPDQSLFGDLKQEKIIRKSRSSKSSEKEIKPKVVDQTLSTSDEDKVPQKKDKKKRRSKSKEISKKQDLYTDDKLKNNLVVKEIEPPDLKNILEPENKKKNKKKKKDKLLEQAEVKQCECPATNETFKTKQEDVNPENAEILQCEQPASTSTKDNLSCEVKSSSPAISHEKSIKNIEKLNLVQLPGKEHINKEVTFETKQVDEVPRKTHIEIPFQKVFDSSISTPESVQTPVKERFYSEAQYWKDDPSGLEDLSNLSETIIVEIQHSEKTTPIQIISEDRDIKRNQSDKNTEIDKTLASVNKLITKELKSIEAERLKHEKFVEDQSLESKMADLQREIEEMLSPENGSSLISDDSHKELTDTQTSIDYQYDELLEEMTPSLASPEPEDIDSTKISVADAMMLKSLASEDKTIIENDFDDKHISMSIIDSLLDDTETFSITEPYSLTNEDDITVTPRDADKHTILTQAIASTDIIETQLHTIHPSNTESHVKDTNNAHNLKKDTFWTEKHVIDDAESILNQRKPKHINSDNADTKSQVDSYMDEGINVDETFINENAFWPDKYLYHDAECNYFLKLASKLKPAPYSDMEIKIKDQNDKDKDKDPGDSSGHSSDVEESKDSSGTPYDPNYISMDLPGGICSWKDHSSYLSVEAPSDPGAAREEARLTTEDILTTTPLEPVALPSPPQEPAEKANQRTAKDELSNDIESLLEEIRDVQTRLSDLPDESLDAMEQGLKDGIEVLVRCEEAADLLEQKVMEYRQEQEVQALLKDLIVIKARITKLLTQARLGLGTIKVSKDARVEVARLAKELHEQKEKIFKLDTWLETINNGLKETTQQSDALAEEDIIRYIEIYEKYVREYEEYEILLKSITVISQDQSSQSLNVKLVATQKALEETRHLVILEIERLRQVLLHIRSAPEVADEDISQTDRTIDSTSMPEEVVSPRGPDVVKDKPVLEKVLFETIEKEESTEKVPTVQESKPSHEKPKQEEGREIEVIKPSMTIETQTGKSLMSDPPSVHDKSVACQPKISTQDVSITCAPPHEIEVQTSEPHSEEKEILERIQIRQTISDGHETIEIASRPVTREPNIEDKSLYVDANYQDDDNHKDSQLNIIHSFPQSFETVMVEPDETTTEVLVDADGTKRIIVRKIRKTLVTRQQTFQTHQQQTHTLSVDGIPQDQSYSQVTLNENKGSKSTAFDDGDVQHIQYKSYGGQVITGIPGGEVTIQEYTSKPDMIITMQDDMKPEEIFQLAEGEIPTHIATSSSSVTAVVQQVTKRIVKTRKRIIRRVVIIDGKEHVSEEIIEEPDNVEVFEEQIPKVTINVKEKSGVRFEEIDDPSDQGDQPSADSPGNYETQLKSTTSPKDGKGDNSKTLQGDEPCDTSPKEDERPSGDKSDTKDLRDTDSSINLVDQNVLKKEIKQSMENLLNKEDISEASVSTFVQTSQERETKNSSQEREIIRTLQEMETPSMQSVTFPETFVELTSDADATAQEYQVQEPLDGQAMYTTQGVQHSTFETSSSNIATVMQSVTRKITRTRKRIIRHIQIINGKEHVTEEVIEEPDDVEIIEEEPKVTHSVQSEGIKSKRIKIMKQVQLINGKEHVIEHVVEEPDDEYIPDSTITAEIDVHISKSDVPKVTSGVIPVPLTTKEIVQVPKQAGTSTLDMTNNLINSEIEYTAKSKSSSKIVKNTEPDVLITTTTTTTNLTKKGNESSELYAKTKIMPEEQSTEPEVTILSTILKRQIEPTEIVQNIATPLVVEQTEDTKPLEQSVLIQHTIHRTVEDDSVKKAQSVTQIIEDSIKEMGQIPTDIMVTGIDTVKVNEAQFKPMKEESAISSAMPNIQDQDATTVEFTQSFINSESEHTAKSKSPLKSITVGPEFSKPKDSFDEKLATQITDAQDTSKPGTDTETNDIIVTKIESLKPVPLSTEAIRIVSEIIIKDSPLTEIKRSNDSEIEYSAATPIPAQPLNLSVSSEELIKDSIEGKKQEIDKTPAEKDDEAPESKVTDSVLIQSQLTADSEKQSIQLIQFLTPTKNLHEIPSPDTSDESTLLPIVLLDHTTSQSKTQDEVSDMINVPADICKPGQKQALTQTEKTLDGKSTPMKPESKYDVSIFLQAERDDTSSRGFQPNLRGYATTETGEQEQTIDISLLLTKIKATETVDPKLQLNMKLEGFATQEPTLIKKDLDVVLPSEVKVTTEHKSNIADLVEKQDSIENESTVQKEPVCITSSTVEIEHLLTPMEEQKVEPTPSPKIVLQEPVVAPVQSVTEKQPTPCAAPAEVYKKESENRESTPPQKLQADMDKSIADTDSSSLSHYVELPKSPLTESPKPTDDDLQPPVQEVTSETHEELSVIESDSFTEGRGYEPEDTSLPQVSMTDKKKKPRKRKPRVASEETTYPKLSTTESDDTSASTPVETIKPVTSKKGKDKRHKKKHNQLGPEKSESPKVGSEVVESSPREESYRTMSEVSDISTVKIVEECVQSSPESLQREVATTLTFPVSVVEEIAMQEDSIQTSPEPIELVEEIPRPETCEIELQTTPTSVSDILVQTTPKDEREIDTQTVEEVVPVLAKAPTFDLQVQTSRAESPEKVEQLEATTQVISHEIIAPEEKFSQTSPVKEPIVIEKEVQVKPEVITECREMQTSPQHVIQHDEKSTEIVVETSEMDIQTVKHEIVDQETSTTPTKEKELTEISIQTPEVPLVSTYTQSDEPEHVIEEAIDKPELPSLEIKKEIITVDSTQQTTPREEPQELKIEPFKSQVIDSSQQTTPTEPEPAVVVMTDEVEIPKLETELSKTEVTTIDSSQQTTPRKYEPVSISEAPVSELIKAEIVTVDHVQQTSPRTPETVTPIPVLALERKEITTIDSTQQTTPRGYSEDSISTSTDEPYEVHFHAQISIPHATNDFIEHERQMHERPQSLLSDKPKTKKKSKNKMESPRSPESLSDPINTELSLSETPTSDDLSSRDPSSIDEGISHLTSPQYPKQTFGYPKLTYSDVVQKSKSKSPSPSKTIKSEKTRLIDTLEKRTQSVMESQKVILDESLSVALLEPSVENSYNLVINKELDEVKNAIENHDQSNTERSMIVVIETISIWLEEIQYKIQRETISGDKQTDQSERIQTLRNHILELKEIIETVDISEEIITLIETLTRQVDAVNTLSKQRSIKVKEIEKEWEKFLVDVDKLSISVDRVKPVLDAVILSDMPTLQKLDKLENIESVNFDNFEVLTKMFKRYRSLVETNPKRECPLKLYNCEDDTKQVENAINTERDRLLQLATLAEEYEQTLQDFGQITDVAEALLDGKIIVSDLDHLHEEIQKHRKFFVNLSHCRAILESLEDNLDSETRSKYSSLHNSLHDRATLIIDRAASRAQQMMLAASRWTLLQQGMKAEQQWLVVAKQRIPDLSNVTSMEHEQYINLYQSISLDVSHHHAKMIRLLSITEGLQGLIVCSGLESECSVALETVLKLQEEVDTRLARLTAFKENWVTYDIIIDRIESWIKIAGRELEFITLENITTTGNLRRFWELKAQHEVYSNLKNESGIQFERALEILPISDEMVQREYFSKIEDKWHELADKIGNIHSAAIKNISDRGVSSGEKLNILEEELRELRASLDGLKGVIRSEDELNLYIERLQVMTGRIDRILNELGRLSLLPTAESERVGALLSQSGILDDQISQELERSLLLKEKIVQVQAGILRCQKNQRRAQLTLEECETAERLGSDVVEKASATCDRLIEDLSSQWRDILALRQALHTLPTSLRVCVSPISVEKDLSALQETHAELEAACGELSSRLRAKLQLWRRFERHLELVQGAVREADYMAELLTVQGQVDYDRLLKATEKLETLSENLTRRSGELMGDLRDAAAPLEASTDPSVAAQLRRDLDDAAAAYEHTCTNLTQLRDKYHKAVELWKRYRDAAAAVRAFTESQEGTLHALRPGDAPSTAQACLEQEVRVAELRSLAAQVAAETGSRALQADADALARRLQLVAGAVQALADLGEARQLARAKAHHAKDMLCDMRQDLTTVDEDGEIVEDKLIALRDNLIALGKSEADITPAKAELPDIDRDVSDEHSIVRILELWQAMFRDTFLHYHRLSTALVRSGDAATALRLWHEYLLDLQSFLSGSVPADYENLTEHRRLCRVHKNLLTSQRSVLINENREAQNRVLADRFDTLTNLHNETLARIVERHDEVCTRIASWDDYREVYTELLRWLKEMEREKEKLQLRYVHMKRIQKLLVQIQNLSDKVPEGRKQTDKLLIDLKKVLEFTEEAYGASVRMEFAGIVKRVDNLQASLDTWRDFLSRILGLISEYEKLTSDLHKMYSKTQDDIIAYSDENRTSRPQIKKMIEKFTVLRTKIEKTETQIETLSVIQEQLKECLSPQDIRLVNQRVWQLRQQRSDLEHQLSIIIHRLQERLEIYTIFESRLTRFTEWITIVESRLESSNQNDIGALDPQDLIRKINSEVQTETAMKEREFEWLTETGITLVELSKKDEKSYSKNTAKHLKDVQERWYKLQETGKSRIAKINELLFTILQLEEKLTEIRLKLHTIESKLSQSVIIEHLTTKHIDDKFKDRDVIHRNIEDESGEVGKALNLCELVFNDPDVIKGNFDLRNLRTGVDIVEKKWKSVCDMSELRKTVLKEIRKSAELSKSLLPKVEKKLDSIEKRVEKIETRKQRGEPEDETVSKAVIKDLEALEADVKRLEDAYSRIASTRGMELRGEGADDAARLRSAVRRWQQLRGRVDAAGADAHRQFVAAHGKAVVSLAEADVRLTRALHLAPTPLDKVATLKELDVVEKELHECQSLVEDADRLSVTVSTVSGVSDMVAEYRALFSDVRVRLNLARAEVVVDVDSAVQVDTLKWETDASHQVDTLTSKETYRAELVIAVRETSEALEDLRTALLHQPKEDAKSDELATAAKEIAKAGAKPAQTLELAKHLSELLLTECDATEDEAMLKEVESLSLRYEDLLAQAKKRELQINNLRLPHSASYALTCEHESGRLTCPLCSERNWKQLDNDLWRLEQWLQFAEATEDARTDPPEQYDLLEDTIQDHREFLLDLDSHKSIVVSLNVVGSHVAQHARSAKDADRVRARLDAANRRWDVACERAAVWQKILQHALVHNQQFHDIVVELVSRLAAAERGVRAREPLRLSRPAAELQRDFRKFSELRDELQRAEPRVHALHDSAQLLRTGDAPHSADDICRRLGELRLRLQSLRKLSGVYALKLGAALARQPGRATSALAAAAAAAAPQLMDDEEEQISTFNLPPLNENDVVVSDESEEAELSNVQRGLRFVCRVARASLPFQALLLLLLGAAALAPHAHSDCRGGLALEPVLRYPDGPPPL